MQSLLLASPAAQILPFSFQAVVPRASNAHPRSRTGQGIFIALLLIKVIAEQQRDTPYIQAQGLHHARHRVACPSLCFDQPLQLFPIQALGQGCSHCIDGPVYSIQVVLNELGLQQAPCTSGCNLCLPSNELSLH